MQMAFRFCNSSTPAGYEEISCSDDKIVLVNLLTHSWYCGRVLDTSQDCKHSINFFQDDGRCPGAFHVGCQEDPTGAPTEPTTTPDPRCTLANNTLGNCECGEQLFIAEDCGKVSHHIYL